MQRYIAVVGGGTCSAEEAAAAERIGALIARADAVLVTARRGLRVSIASPGMGEAETMSVRRTRVFLVPA